MAQNVRTPAGGTARALENVASQVDNSRDIAPAHHLQACRLRQRFSFSPALASAVAELAFPVLEDWRGRA